MRKITMNPSGCDPCETGFTLQRDAWERLMLVDSAGQRHPGVTPLRMFPLSDPERWIALVDCEGHELLTLASIDDAPPASRALLAEELRRRDFLPVVRRIVRVSSGEEPSTWDVETDRGRTTFQLNGEDDIRRLANEGLLLTDTAGVRYRIPRPRDLDSASRRFLERYV